MSAKTCFKKWTFQEDERLRDLVCEGLEDGVIAARLGRTEKAVSARRCELGRKHGVSLSKRRKAGRAR